MCLVSGGLGPTHDDRTVELVARVAGVSLRVDEQLEREIEGRLAVDRRAPRPAVRGLRRGRDEAGDGAGRRRGDRRGRDGSGARAAGRSAASTSCSPALPGELRRLWPAAVASKALGAVLRRTTPAGRHVLRLFGASESAVAKALADAGGDGDGVEATICARDFEIHVDLVVEPGAEERGEMLAAALRSPLAPYLFAEDERSVAEIVLELCRERGYRLATAESCTGGLVAARLSDIAGRE